MNSHEVFIHIHQGCFAGTGAIVRLPQCQWSKPDGYGKISQCITTTKHSKAKTVCIFLGIYCIYSMASLKHTFPTKMDLPWNNKNWPPFIISNVLLNCGCFILRVNTLRPKQNGHHFPDDIFRCIVLNENVWTSIKISLKFVPNSPIKNIPALVQIMAWCRPGDKPLSETIKVSSLTPMCVSRIQWVKPVTTKLASSRPLICVSFTVLKERVFQVFEARDKIQNLEKTPYTCICLTRNIH